VAQKASNTTNTNSKESVNSFCIPAVFSNNVNGLLGKFCELEQLCVSSYSTFSIINIQESKLKKEQLSGPFEIKDFHFIRLDRDIEVFSENGGGGLVSYINKKWCHNAPHVISTISHPDIELLAFICRPFYLPSGYRCVINVNIYLRPQRNKQSSNKILRKEIEKIISKHPKSFIIVCGDANIDKLTVLENFNLTNLIDVPTFYPTKSCLDVAYVTDKKFYTVRTEPPIGKAATCFHLSIVLDPTINCGYKTKRNTVTTTAINHQNLEAQLISTDWSIFENNNINIMADNVDSYIEYLVEINSSRFNTAEPLERQNSLQLKLFVKQKNAAIKEGNKFQRNLIQRKINSEVRRLRCEKIAKMSSSELFQCVNKALHKKGSYNKLPTVERANEMNEYFTRFNEDKYKDTEICKNDITRQDNEVKLTIDAVKHEFKKIKSTSSSGPSKIPAVIFKKHENSLCGIYRTIFEKSLCAQTYPSSWKKALVTPILKSRNLDENNLKNYRPVAVTPIQARILDKIALSFMEKSMKIHEDNHQFAYKEKYDTTDALLWTWDFILSTLDNQPGSMVKSLFLDYSSAFNTILQNKLILKVRENDECIANWLKSYMDGWSQSVKAHKQKESDPIVLKVGTPQGGPLSAKLFTYVTDSLNNTNMHVDNKKGDISKYSDDTRLIYTISKEDSGKDQRDYQEICNQIVEKSDENNLKLNVAKCGELVFSHGVPKDRFLENVKIKQMDVPRLEKIKYLGVFMSSNLKWSHHVNCIVQKLNFIIKHLTLILPFTGTKIKSQLLHSHIIPHLLYACEVWGPALQQNQRKQIKKCTKYFSRVSKMPLQTVCDIINKAYENRIISRTKKINAMPNHPLHEKLQNCHQNRYNTRRAINTIFSRTTSYGKSFIPLASRQMAVTDTITLL